MSWDLTQRVERAFQQRIYLIEFQKADDGATFVILGNSRRVYNVVLNDTIECTCPDYAQRKHFCKHCLFVTLRVLCLSYEEVAERFDGRNRSVDERVLSRLLAYFDGIENNNLLDEALQATAGERNAYHKAIGGEDQADVDAARRVEQKPVTDDDLCPVCFEAMNDEKELVIFCQYSCGKSIHADCFSNWAARRKDPTCVYCRALWFGQGNQSDDVEKSDGYIALPPRRRNPV